MSIIRVRKTEKFTVVSNVHINDDRLSWKATSLLTYLLSKPNDWTVYAKQLASAKKDGIKAVYSGLRELKDLGYIEHVFIRGEDGKVQAGEYIVHEEPLDMGTPANKGPLPDTQKGDAVKGDADNGRLLNTNLNQTLKDNNDGQQPPPPPPPSNSLDSLISKVPEDYQTKAVSTAIEKALTAHSEGYVKSAIEYTNDKSTGQTAAKYKAYLGKTIEGGWAYGYKSEADENISTVKKSFEGMPDDVLGLMADAGNSFAVSELERRKTLLKNVI